MSTPQGTQTMQTATATVKTATDGRTHIDYGGGALCFAVTTGPSPATAVTCEQCRHADRALSAARQAIDGHDVTLPDAEAVERGWVCPDGDDHHYDHVTDGDRTVDAKCTRCGQHGSEER